MNDRLFRWGLSNGATMLGIAGAFWIGLAVATFAPRVHWSLSAVATLVQVGGLVTIVWAAARLRRRSGFKGSDLRRAEGIARAQNRYIQTRMLWTVAGQTVLIAFAVWISVRLQVERMIWPSIGAIVSLHLVPLARIFHVRAYYATSAAGTIVCLVGFATSGTPYGVVWFSAGLAAVMWVSAAHVLIRADRITEQAVGERWAV